MGFYGNITNTSNTTFQFDRIYSNRLSMDANANNDGIFIGRYVLVEYDNKATISNIFVDTQHPAKTVDGEKYYYAYTTDNFTDINTRIQYKPNNRGENKNLNVYFLGEFGQVQKTEGNQLQQEYYTEFYQCVDSIVSGQDSTISYALFKYVTKSNTTDSEYIKNFAIDEAQYKEKKGYDSTVWTKASVKKPSGLLVTEYVRIADLNSVVPTFDLETDAPTMKPLVPHFDADSTNVYYKLHTQPQWGLRVAEVESGKISDSKTNWISSTYDPETGQLIPSEDNGEHDAAIYFNKAAFLSQVDINRKTTDGINKKKEDNQEKNYFTINPTGISGNQYYLHTALDQNGNLQKVYGSAVDIQEMEINLPAIGNMMSDAWDIIYGPKRDKARTDDDGSLQGRLDSFKAIEDNHIPVKRNDDGTIIGTAINGNKNYQMPNGKNILTTTYFPLTTNDPWINVTIDNNSLQGGYDKDNKIEISQKNNNAIHIRHDANSVDPTTTSWDKNDTENYTNNSYSYYEIDTNINGNQDEIKLYTPYVDATGHVVGKNIETVTLPYGYKTFTTNGLGKDEEGKEVVTDLHTKITINEDGANTSFSEADATQTVASNTQDSMAIEPCNKWIQTQMSDDKLVIAHEVHAINTEKSSTDLNDLKDNKIQNEINIPDWDYDEAGHIKKKGEHIYTLPYGYKTIQTGNSDAVTAAPVNTADAPTADNTQDTLNLNASNKWIKFNTINTEKNNEVQIGHILNQNTNDANKDFGLSSDMTIQQIDDNNNQFNIPVIQFDEAGHIIKAETHKVQLPNGFTTFTSTISNTDNADSTSGKAGSFSPDTMTDTIILAEGNQWINIEASEDTFTFKHYAQDFNKSSDSYDFNNSKQSLDRNSFTTTDWSKDRAGHLTAGKDTVYTLPNGIKTLSIQDTGKDNVSIVTGSTGQLTADNLVDTMTIDNGNRWIRLVANGKTVKLYHDAPNSASGSNNTTNANDNTNKTLSFNSTFEVPQVKYDETGHIFGIGKHTITLPSTSTLRLNGYSKGTSTAAITTNETINSAFGKLENRLDVLQGGNTQVGSVAYQIAQIVNENNNGSVDTLNEIANWIINDSTGAAKMANDISDLKTKMGSSSVATQIANKINALDKTDTAQTGQYVSAVSETNGIITVTRESLPTLSTGSVNGTIKLGNDNEVAVKGLGSAAFTERSAYAKSDILDTKFKYGETEEQKTIADLMNKVAELETELNKLKNPPQEPDEGGETV